MSSIRVNDDLELRLLREQDAEALFDLTERNRERLEPWMTWLDRVRSVPQAREFIRFLREDERPDARFAYGIWHRGELVGFLDMHDIDWTAQKAEFGYWIGAAHEGKGLVTAACRALLDHCFEGLGIERVEVKCTPDNVRSRRVPERLGFRQKEVIRQAEWHRDHFVDYVVYAMESRDWRKLNRTAQGG